MASIDARFADDIEQVRLNPNIAVDPVDFTDAERQRNHFLYSLLSSLLRQRPLLVVRNVTGSNALEAYRLLVQQNEPVSKNRGMGLLNVIMNWPAFTGKLSLMQQLLCLEHAFAEYEKLGTKFNEDLKTAILMRSLTGQLKVWLQLHFNESTTYAKVREMVLRYDSNTTKWSEQMVLGTDSSMSTAEGPVPMEIDRVEPKGKSKGAKGKWKSSSEGKSKGKGKSKDAKGKGKSSDQNQKGSKGNASLQNDRSKGKGKGDPKACYICGRTGHVAKDCWHSGQVRQVGSEVAAGSTAVQGSPSSSLGGMSSVSQQHPAPPSSSTQYKVARICEVENVSSDNGLVFDVRDSSPASLHGSVHAIYHYIGDSSEDACDESFFSGAVRTISNESMASERLEEVHDILLDSGADASIFPSSLLGRGKPAAVSVGRLVDAQGVEIPSEATQDMEIALRDMSGRVILLRETVAVSDRVSQPILSFGKVLENGRGIDGNQQMLVHTSAGAAISLELQNKSMIVHGSIRVLTEPGIFSRQFSCQGYSG